MYLFALLTLPPSPPPHPDSSSMHRLKIALVVALYWVSSMAVVFLNKFMLVSVVTLSLSPVCLSLVPCSSCVQ